MRLGHAQLNGCSGHEAGLALLEAMYLQETGRTLPEICRTPQGKPYFPGGDWHFSISHTKNHVFCCLSHENLGVDAEEVGRLVKPSLADKVLSPREKARCLASSDTNAALLRLWVLKEAYAKLTGRGLGEYLYHTDFSPDDDRVQIFHGCYVAVLTQEDIHAL